MRKLLRSKASHQFLTGDGSWTDQVQLARSFTDSSEARDLIRQYNLRDVNLYYLFSDDHTTPFDFTIEL